MGRKLFVGNLSFNTGEDILTSIFSNYGSVETAKVVSDRDTGKSKGFAFVEMASEVEARAAIDGLNGKEQDGRALNVSEARPAAPREDRNSFRQRRY